MLNNIKAIDVSINNLNVNNVTSSGTIVATHIGNGNEISNFSSVTTNKLYVSNDTSLSDVTTNKLEVNGNSVFNNGVVINEPVIPGPGLTVIDISSQYLDVENKVNLNNGSVSGSLAYHVIYTIMRCF